MAMRTHLEIISKLTALGGTLLIANSAFCGVPASEEGASAKWIRVSEAWTIDTDDVDRDGDELRFWVRRTAVGNEEMSTQRNGTWTGKLRVRCGDFHARTEAQVNTGFGTDYSVGAWEKIDKSMFAWTLASNFCYLTGTPGFTPEPEEHEWQKKIANLLKNAKPKQSKSKNVLCSNSMYASNNTHICD